MKDVNVEVLKELSIVEVREMLEEWDQEMETKPKLEILKRIVKLESVVRVCKSGEKADRRMMINLRGGMAGSKVIIVVITRAQAIAAMEVC